MRDRGGGRWSGWCKVYPHEDVRAARVRVVKSDNTRATGSGLTALKEATVRKGVGDECAAATKSPCGRTNGHSPYPHEDRCNLRGVRTPRVRNSPFRVSHSVLRTHKHF